MPSKTQRKIQFARERGIVVHIVPFYTGFSHSHSGWYVFDDREYLRTGKLDMTQDEIFGPYLSKRQAKNIAYGLAIGQAV